MNNKIIVRNKLYGKGELDSNWIMKMSEYKFNSLEKFKDQFSDKYIMQELFDENINQEKLKDSLLYKKYEEIRETDNDNEFFRKIYKVKDDLAVSLSEHIYLHYIIEPLKINNKRILPWECIGSKIYIADTWWETDEDILHDLTNMSLVDFMEKYKGY